MVLRELLVDKVLVAHINNNTTGILFFFRVRVSCLLVDFCLTYVSVVQDSPRRGSQHELGGLVWEDVEGQESFPVSAGFELITQGLLVKEHKLLSQHTHSEEY